MTFYPRCFTIQNNGLSTLILQYIQIGHPVEIVFILSGQTSPFLLKQQKICAALSHQSCIEILTSIVQYIRIRTTYLQLKVSWAPLLFATICHPKKTTALFLGMDCLKLWTISVDFTPLWSNLCQSMWIYDFRGSFVHLVIPHKALQFRPFLRAQQQWLS